MPSQRLILGTSLAILLVISAASIGLDLKSQSDKASVDHTVGMLQKIADLRLLVRRAESVARGFGLTRDPNFTRDSRKPPTRSVRHSRASSQRRKTIPARSA